MAEGTVENQQKKSRFRKGLALTLYLWFMVLSVGPVLLVSINEYKEAEERIIADRHHELSAINTLLTQRINDYFDSVITNLFIKARATESFINLLVEGYVAEQLSPQEYIINSEGYGDIARRFSAEYIDFLRFYDYSDVIIGDVSGNLLYTVNGYEDLGQNLFHGKLSTTLFAQAARMSLDELQPKYSDLGTYPPVGDEKVSFFILPVVDDHQDAVGFIAVQIHANNIQSIFEQEHQLGGGLHSYLVGTDRGIRFGSDITAERDLNAGKDNPLINLWLEHLDPETGVYQELDSHLEDGSHDHGFDLDISEGLGDSDLDDHNHDSDFESESDRAMSEALQTGSNHIRVYKNYEGQTVLGTFLPVSVSGTSMAMVSEVPQAIAFASVNEFRYRMIILISVVIFLVMVIGFIVSRRLIKPILVINQWVNKVASGEDVEAKVFSGKNELSELSQSFVKMTEQLGTIKKENERRSWLQDGLAGLNDSVRGDQNSSELCRNIVGYLAKYLNMQTGAMYVMSDENRLQLMGSYAWRERKQYENSFGLGEGLVGQAALEQQVIELTHIPDNYLDIESGLGKTKPPRIIIIPLVYENEVKGVIEFAYLEKLNSYRREFIELSTENVAIAINSAQSRARVTELLGKTTQQSEAMKEQQEELKAVNEELEKRAQILEESEEEMRAQSEELQKSNAELEEKSEQLTLQKEEIEIKNRDIELTSKKIEEKATELEQASKYKSEFLANMSHELRTPLNSLLLLAQMLADNDEGNLTEDQVESAEVIYNGGKELLELINDILDLSKVEAGKMSINLDDTRLEDICHSLQTMFGPLAESKNLEYKVEIEKGTTEVILTDSQRLLQIVKNFLSNAFKFTEEGGVYIRIFTETRAGHFGQDTFIGFAVRDTGIGIPKEKQASIFESFQQADGSTSRKYGGTGLGLAISREMSSLLGGFIEIESEEGEGTTFTLFLPDNAVCSLSGEKVLADTFSSGVSDGQIMESQPSPKKEPEEPASAKPSEPVVQVQPMSERSLLLIEDDVHFVDILEQVARKNQFEYAHAKNGKEGLQLAAQLKPAAIILDLGLPDIDGKQVLEGLKANEITKDIPVHIISGRDPETETEEGSVGYLVKPVTVADLDDVFLTLGSLVADGIKQVLILDPDVRAREQTGELLKKKGIYVDFAGSAEEAERKLEGGDWECLVMEADLGSVSGVDFLAGLKNKLKDNMPPVVIETARELTKEEHIALQEYTSAMVIKGEMSAERIIDEVSLFLHAIERDSPEVAKKAEKVVSSAEKDLKGHKILLVDDDLRNTFALSKALQGLGLEVIIADNGQSALDKLAEEAGIELILMDVMMPVMDGYEATRQIRTMDQFKELPVISLTAKAMSDDRAKCLEAGANDYMTKPVDMDQMVEMLKVWLFK